MKISTITERIIRENDNRKDFLDKLHSCEDSREVSFVCINKTKFLNSIPYAMDIPIEDYLSASIEELHKFEYAILETREIKNDIQRIIKYYFHDIEQYMYLDDFVYTYGDLLDFIRFPENKVEVIKKLFKVYMSIPVMGDAYDTPEGGRSDYFLRGVSVFALGGDYKSVCRQACWMGDRLCSMNIEDNMSVQLHEWLYELQRDYESMGLFEQFYNSWTLSHEEWNPSPIDYILFFLNRRSTGNAEAIIKFIRYYLVRYTIWLSYIESKYHTLEIKLTHHYTDANGCKFEKEERLLDGECDFMMSKLFPFNFHFVSCAGDTVRLDVYSEDKLWRMQDRIPEMSITERIARAVEDVANSGLMKQKKEHVLIRYIIANYKNIQNPMTVEAYVDLIHNSKLNIPDRIRPTMSSSNSYQIVISGDYPHEQYKEKNSPTVTRYRNIITKFLESYFKYK